MTIPRAENYPSIEKGPVLFQIFNFKRYRAKLRMATSLSKKGPLARTGEKREKKVTRRASDERDISRSGGERAAGAEEERDEWG